MASTTFIPGTTIASTWLNDVNTAVYINIPLLAPLIAPTFVNPTLGNATAASINQITFNTPPTGANFTIGDSKSFTINNTLTLSGTDGSTINYGAGGTLGTVAYSTATPTNGYVLTGNGTAWVPTLPSTPYLPVSSRTSNTAIVVGDQATLIDITSGTFTQTFGAVASFVSGWYCYIRNSGTGDITLDPSGSEQIDGLTSYIMYPGEMRLVTCDATKFTTVVLKSFYRAFTVSSTFITPPGYSYFEGLAWSGGSSGEKSSVGIKAGGGGGGGCVDFRIPAATMSTSQVITIGAGGAANTTTAIQVSGGATSIGSIVSVFGSSVYFGGYVSTIGISAGNHASVGYEAGANDTQSYNTMWGGVSASNNASGPSGSSVYGGAGGGAINISSVLQAAGTSKFGGNGGAASVAGNGTDGVAPGGGGGATATGSQSGAGARGEVRIWGIA